MKEMILIVDDDPMYIDLVSNLLETQHCQVLAAKDGAKALGLLEKNKVDLIVSDVEMPTMSGFEFQQRVRKIDRYAATPFVFLTGTTDTHKLEQARKLPNTRVIQKVNLVHDLLDVLGGLDRPKQ